MRVLLATIGTRGEVQPVLGLALELRALGQEARVVAPPDFRAWIEGHGVEAVPIGPELRATASPPAASGPPSPERWRGLAAETVAAQFATLAGAARGCDVLLAGGALMVAARSIAEAQGLRYAYASYCPVTLPSAAHAPPPLPSRPPADPAADNRALWARDAQGLSAMFGEAVNAHRAALGLAPVADLRGHVFTDRPWLAADPTLAPAGAPLEGSVLQTGAWLLRDPQPLPAEVEAFLAAGEPPVYFGFGSVRAPPDLGRSALAAARALGRRAVVSRGWAGVEAERAPDCLPLGDVSHAALFPRLAAAVHHGGAGTTTAAARAGLPQVVVPQMYDQHYWARRVAELGIGVAHAPGAPTADSLADALRRALEPEVARRARAVAGEVRADGARVAAERLIDLAASA